MDDFKILFLQPDHPASTYPCYYTDSVIPVQYLYAYTKT